MAIIKVHVLNFHSIWSHIEIVLENTSTEPPQYYGVNRWEYPAYTWSQRPKDYISMASSTYNFMIEADPQKLLQSWEQYWIKTREKAGILTHNCAVAVQWFLSKHAGIPEPGLSNISVNHLALGVPWPSFIPCPITLPGRIMSNAKFYVESIQHPEIAQQHSKLFLYTSMALSLLIFSASVFALLLASTVLTTGLATLMAVGSITTGVAGAYGFFTSYNILSEQNVAEELKKSGDHHPLKMPGYNGK